jgi:hypothetical protein
VEAGSFVECCWQLCLYRYDDKDPTYGQVLDFGELEVHTMAKIQNAVLLTTAVFHEDVVSRWIQMVTSGMQHLMITGVIR